MIAAICAFVLYKVKTHRQVPDTTETGFNQDPVEKGPPGQEMVSGMEQAGDRVPSGALRYPDTILSGKTQGEY